MRPLAGRDDAPELTPNTHQPVPDTTLSVGLEQSTAPSRAQKHRKASRL